MPTAGINLISIGVVTAIPGMKVEFEDRDVVFKLNGTVEMNGQQGSGKTLYRLNIKAITEVKQDIAYAANSKLSSASLIIWHRRCGHVNYRTLLDMASGQAVKGMVITNHILRSQTSPPCLERQVQRLHSQVRICAKQTRLVCLFPS